MGNYLSIRQSNYANDETMMWNGDRDIVDIDQYKAFISMEWMDLTTSAIWYRNF